MWVNHLFYLGVPEQLLCTCLHYSFVGLSLVRCVAVLNVLGLGHIFKRSIMASSCILATRPSVLFVYL
jgi:hypothetical protein